MNIPIGERHVSHSQLWQAHNCEWKWYIRNVMDVRSARQYRAPNRGSAIHVGCAALLLSQNVRDEVQIWAEGVHKEINEWESLGWMEGEEDHGMIDSLIEPSIDICHRWWDWLDYDTNWETICDDAGPIVERAFMCDLPPFRGFMGVVDWVARHKPTDRVFVIDHKTRQQMRPPEVEETNLQKAIYQYMLRQNGIETDGSAIMQIWHEPPRQPKVNKDGQLSRAKIRTTWESYAKAVLDAGFDVDSYAEMEAKCNPIEDFFRFSFAYRTREEVDGTWALVARPRARRIVELLEDDEIIPRRALGSMDCERCWARETCLEGLRGRPFEDAIQTGGLFIKTPSMPEPDTELDGEEEFEV